MIRVLLGYLLYRTSESRIRKGVLKLGATMRKLSPYYVFLFVILYLRSNFVAKSIIVLAFLVGALRIGFRSK